MPPTFDQECFFIAPIGAEGSEERRRSDQVLQYIVMEAAKQLGLEAIRADQISAPGQINHQVLEHLQQARAVVADLSGQNPNVFYELGVRHSFNLPCVLIAETGETLPFDLVQARTIFFNHRDLESAARCRQQIVAHLSEAFGGSVDSPVTSALDVASLRVGSPVERQVGELVHTTAELAQEVQGLRLAAAGAEGGPWPSGLDARARLAGEVFTMAKDVFNTLATQGVVPADRQLLVALVNAAASIALPPKEGLPDDAIARALPRSGGSTVDAGAAEGLVGMAGSA